MMCRRYSIYSASEFSHSIPDMMSSTISPLCHLVSRFSLANSSRGVNLYLCQYEGRLNEANQTITIGNLAYHPFCDDFGPMNLATVHEFCEILHAKLDANQDDAILVQSSRYCQSFTNAVFLLGAYMILKLAMTPAQVAAHFAWMDPRLVAPYRDASFHIPDFGLELID